MQLYASFADGTGVRATARNLKVDRGTVATYRRQWIKETLHYAYYFLSNGDREGCEHLAALVPKEDATAMFDAWLEDQCGTGPKSEWYELGSIAESDAEADEFSEWFKSIQK